MPVLKIPVSSEDHTQGPDSARVTLVEYGDYECPSCGRAHPTIKRLQKRFGSSLRFVFRNFPLSKMHPHAQAAAEAAEFAATQGKFWEMHDMLFENQSRLSTALLLEFAHELDLSSEALEAALDEAKFAPRVHADFSGGVRSGVNGTPAFFINSERYDGSWEFPELLLVVDHAVGSAQNPAAD